MRNKNILLINPWIYDFAAFDLWIKPLGLLYIASFLEKFGYSLHLIDCLNRHHPAYLNLAEEKRPKTERYDTGHFYHEEIAKPDIFKDIKKKFKRYGLPKSLFLDEVRKKPEPILIGLTCTMTYWYPGVFETISLLKQIYPDVPIVLGGLYSTLLNKHARKHSGADYIFTHDGRMNILKLADELTHTNRNYTCINLDLDNSPFPAYHLIENLHSASIITSTGCPFKCSYCASKILYPEFIKRDWKRVLEEIIYYKEVFGINDIAFYDDALLFQASEHIKLFFRQIIEEKYDFRFHMPNGIHIRFIDREIAGLFYASGVKTLRLSFESTAREIQTQSSDSKTGNRHIKNAIAYLLAAGFKSAEIQVYVMMGLPNQRIKDVLKSIDFVHELGATIKTVQYSPIPGTKDFKVIAEANPDIEKEPLYTNNTIFPIKSNVFSLEDYQEIRSKARKLNEKLK